MHSESIDKTNRDGYDAIAAEFDDRRRPTTANFHELSRSFIQQVLGACKNGAEFGDWSRKWFCNGSAFFDGLRFEFAGEHWGHGRQIAQST